MNKGTIILVISLSLLIAPEIATARKTPPLAKEFEVKYDKGPYENVMTANQVGG